MNAGYDRTEIADAIAAQAKELAYYHAYVGHGTEASITLARMIIERAPKYMSRVYFGLSGSDVNETNVKLVWYYNNVLGRPQKKKNNSRWRGYHDSGLMTGSLTGLELFHKQFDLPLPQVIHTEAPYYFRRPVVAMSEEQFSAYCADQLDKLIRKEGAENVAAFIGEPVLGTGGIVPPPIVGLGLHEVEAPDMVGVFGPQTDAGAVVEPEAGPFGCFLGTFSPSRRQIRWTRSLPTSMPPSFSRAVTRR